METPHIDQTLLSGVSADETTSSGIAIDAQTKYLTLYVIAGAGVASGVVELEEAHDPSYSGTWAQLGTVTTNAASKVFTIHVTGAHKAVRARISTVIGGGTISARLVGN